MQNSKIFLITLILISFVGLYIFNNQIESQFTNETIQINSEINQKTIANRIKNEIKEITDIKSNENNTDKQTVTAFHIDPVVNKAIIEQKYSHCSQMFLLQQNNSVRNSNYQKLIKNKPDYYKKHFENCQKINSNFPEFNLDKQNITKDDVANSHLGRVLTDSEYAESYLEDNIDLFIKDLFDADPNMMLSIYAEVSVILAFSSELQQLLNSQQHDYSIMIGGYAQKLLACRLGADCGGNSTLMFKTCLNNQNLCANSFDELIKTKFSEGQKADIELVYEYLVNYYKIEE